MLFDKNKKVQRQDWKPHPVLRVLYRVWRIAYSGLKIALGALATVLLICVVCAFVFANFLGSYLQEDVMSRAEMNLDDYNLDKTSYIYYLDENDDIQILQQIYSTTDRRWASYEELPEDLIHACVAIEDKRFYEHQGVDWITTVKACLSMFFGGDQFGGSTITQQLIKNLKEEDSITVQRKVIEIFRAMAFEKKYDKETVLEWYMNTVYFGEGCYGVKSAADNYFGKELQDMTTAELASLIGITNNPSLYRPYRTTLDAGDMNGAQRNRERQEVILAQMLEQGWIDEEKYEEAMDQEMVFKRGIALEDTWTQCKDRYDDDSNLISTGCGLSCAVRDLITQEGSNIYTCPACGNIVDITTDASQSIYSWYVDQVLDDVARALAEQNGEEWCNKVRENYLELISRAGYHIYTPYDAEVQAIVDSVYTDLSKIPAVYSGQQLQSAIVITDNTTGDIVALAGGVGEKDTFDAYNRATDARLQVGSAIKPLTVYSQAFELGLVTPATVIDDLPITTLNGKPYPSNVEKQYHYSRTILNGVVQSVNTLSVNTLDMIGTQYSYEFTKNQYGLSYLTDHYVSSTGTIYTDVGYSALGMGGLTVGATVRQMTDAYGTFSNNGVYREGRVFTKVYDSDGQLVLDNQQVQRTILSQKAVNYMNYCLDKAVDALPGVDLAAELGMDMCGKTGSTNDYKDRYFCGFTGYYTAAVWCGFDTPEEIHMVDANDSPANNLWRKVMVELHRGKETVPLYDTEGMVQVSICLDSGKLATEACRCDIRSGDTNRVQSGIWVYQEDAPTEFCDKHISVEYCGEGGACANSWCKKFASVGAIRLDSVSLVKMTQSRIDRLVELEGHGLMWYYLRSDYIYLVDDMGNPLPYHGMHGNLNTDSNLPYLSCKLHTEAAWESYKAGHPWVDTDILGGSEPVGTDPVESTDTTEPTGSVIPEETED